MKLVNVFKALSDKTRVRIMALLFEGDLCVCEVMDALGMTQSRVSRHLGILKQAGLIGEERKGKWVVYKVINKRRAIFSYIQRETKGEPEYEKDMKNLKKTQKKNLCPFNC